MDEDELVLEKWTDSTAVIPNSVGNVLFPRLNNMFRRILLFITLILFQEMRQDLYSENSLALKVLSTFDILLYQS